MSIRAYITRERSIWVDEKNETIQYNNDGDNLVKYTHKDFDYVINIWHQDKLIEEMLNYGAEDYTNSDYIGEIEMSKEEFEAMCKHSDMDFTEEDLDSIKTIKKYFEEKSDWLILTCC